MGKRSAPKITDESSPLLHAARWRFGPWLLDESKRELSRDGLVVALEAKPLNMLMLLLRYPGELITKADLMEALWTGRIVTDSVLSNCAAKLRTALGDDERLLRTVHGYGYRLEAHPKLESEATATPEVSSIFTAGASVPFRPNWEFTRQLGLTGETWLAVNRVTAAQRVFKFARTPRGLAALKREVTLYRLLRHHLEDRAPVVDLLDWNFDEPPWFLELHYCTLGSLAEYLDGQGGAKALTLEARIALIIQLAEGLSLVHNHGVLHKDLKPANVMAEALDHGGVRLVLADFGSGRLLDPQQLESLAITRLGFTQFGESSNSSSSTGTPLYYAPEVLSGQPVTLKSDIYALGVIAYQLIVGDLRRLFAPGWEQEITDELLREDIAACAAGDPAKRLADAQLLADRLRHLPLRRAERAAEAQKIAEQQALAQALREAKVRRRGLLLTSAALAAGLTASLALYWQAARDRSKAERSAQTARVTSQFVLQDLLSEVSRDDQPVQTLRMHELLLSAASKIDRRFGEQPLVAISIRQEIGKGLRQLGYFDLAAVQLDQALRLALATPSAEAATRAALLAELMPMEQTLAYPEQRLRRYLRLYQPLAAELSPIHPLILELDWQLSGQEHRAGMWSSAVRRLERTARAARSNANVSSELRQKMEITLAHFYADIERYSEAAEIIHQGIPNIQRLYGKNHRKEAQMRLKLAEIHTAQQHYALAKAELDHGRKIVAQWEIEPADLSQMIGIIAVRLATAQGNLPVARQALLQLNDIYSRAGMEDHTQGAIFQRLLGNIARAENDHAAAERFYRLALSGSVADYGEKHPAVENLRVDLARTLCRLNQRAECASVFNSINANYLKELLPSHTYNINYTALKTELFGN